MIIDFLVQFLIEFLRALLIDGLSEHVRTRAERARRNRRLLRYIKLRAGRAERRVRSFSTEEPEKVE
jgi:hypothetical protein